MSPVTVVWSMIAAASLTLAAVHLPVWLRNHGARANLAFAIVAASTGALSYFELRVLQSKTTTELAEAMRWGHVPIAVLLAALAAFAHYYLDASWRALAMVAIGVRLISLVLDFTIGANLNFVRINEVVKVPLLGETVSAPSGVPNPWMAVGQLSAVLLSVYFAHAAVGAWRSGRRPAAVFVGGSCVFFTVAGVGQSILVYWGLIPPAPSTLGPFCLGIVLVMGYALSADLLRATRLVAELGERQHEADLAADAASLGIWTRDIVRDSISASQKWRELFGFSASELLSAERVAQRVHVDDRGAVWETFTHAVPSQGDYESEFRLVLPDGRTRWIAALGRVDFDAKGKPLRSRGACIDVTARKHAEQEMLRLRQDIAHVGRVSVMGQISAALAHEINQPLGAILRNAEAAALFIQHDTPDLHEISAILEDIRKDDQRATEVIDRIRALLRREEIAMTTLDVGQVLRDVATLLRPDAAARNVPLELKVPATLPAVRGDEVQVQQVLLNLILNGIDAHEGLADRSRSVSVTARHTDEDSVEISVADEGQGIAAAHLARIFEPFFTTKTKGIGMGLSISRSIIESHGGRLWAANNPVAGATFSFTLPTAAT